MKKLKKNIETPIVLKNESLKDFFARGRKIAKILDQEKLSSFKLAEYPLPIRTISFEDVHDLVKFLTDSKLNLVSAVRKKTFSISDLAKTLHRSRSAVDKDTRLLESVGILKSKYVVNPGHGRCRMVTAFDKKPIKLMVEATI